MVDSKKVLEIIRAIGLKMEVEKKYPTELDQPTGDSDYGINMARGSAAVEGKLPDLEGKDIGTILKTAGMILVSTVGGASGLLYGSAYMKAGMALAGKGETDMDGFLSMMDTAVQAVEQRGKATVEEATMLSTMVPSLKTMKDAAVEGESVREALKIGVRVAWAGAEYTRDLAAIKGRASYVGEGGLGYQDPRATSYSYMLRVIAGLVQRQISETGAGYKIRHRAPVSG